MNSKFIHPRPDQIEVLTYGIQLPLAPLSVKNLIFIAELLQRAWDELLQEHQTKLSSSEEKEINAMMRNRLNALIDADNFWSLLVKCVARGDESISYDGSHLELRPDLNIYITERNSNFPLIVECKLLEARSKKGVDLYCDNGIMRFVQGEYAWSAREAFMLAYVRDRSTIDLCLKPFLAESQAKQTDLYLTETLPKLADHPSMQLAHSSHNRQFSYINQPQNQPGAIVVWHLWVSI